MGVARVRSREELRAAIEAAREHDPKVVVEAAVFGREIECGVLEGRDTDPPRTSELGECIVVQNHEFYDFDAKYLPEEQVRLDVPADVDPELAAQVRELAVRTFEAIGCEGLARVDFFLTTDGAIVGKTPKKLNVCTSCIKAGKVARA